MTETQKLVLEYLRDYSRLLEENERYVTAEDVRETARYFEKECDE